jgi:hypothetical protein
MAKTIPQQILVTRAKKQQKRKQQKKNPLYLIQRDNVKKCGCLVTYKQDHCLV